MATAVWRVVTPDEDMQALERNPTVYSCAVDLLLEGGASKRLDVVTEGWLRRHFAEGARWAAFGPLLVLADAQEGQIRGELTRMLEEGHVHAFYLARAQP